MTRIPARGPLTAALLAVVGVLMLLAAGCGVPTEVQPRPLPTQGVVPTASQTPAPEPTAAAEQATLWFVKGGQLVPAMRSTEGPLNPQDLIDLLAAGPTEQEAAAGLRTAVVSVVTREPLVETARSQGVAVDPLPRGTEAIVLAPEFTDLLAAEQVLVLGEVVTTLTVGATDALLFVDENGAPLGVPLPDGRLDNGPVGPGGLRLPHRAARRLRPLPHSTAAAPPTTLEPQPGAWAGCPSGQRSPS